MLRVGSKRRRTKQELLDQKQVELERENDFKEMKSQILEMQAANEKLSRQL